MYVFYLCIIDVCMCAFNKHKIPNISETREALRNQVARCSEGRWHFVLKLRRIDDARHRSCSCCGGWGKAPSWKLRLFGSLLLLPDTAITPSAAARVAKAVKTPRAFLTTGDSS